MTDSPEPPLDPQGRLFTRLAAAGFRANGVVSAGRFESLVPDGIRRSFRSAGVRSVVVVASGGRSLFDAFQASPEANSALQDPLDSYTERCLGEAVDELDRAGQAAQAVFAHRAIGGVYLDFVALGEAAGLGAPSRLGLLVHPEYGPWLSIRAALLTSLTLVPTGPVRDFAPCHECPAPCAAACPGEALAAARFDVAACHTTRSGVGDCSLHCAARRACVAGPEHRYHAAAEAHHMAALDAFLASSPPWRGRP